MRCGSDRHLSAAGEAVDLPAKPRLHTTRSLSAGKIKPIRANVSVWLAMAELARVSPLTGSLLPVLCAEPSHGSPTLGSQAAYNLV